MEILSYAKGRVMGFQLEAILVVWRVNKIWFKLIIRKAPVFSHHLFLVKTDIWDIVD